MTVREPEWSDEDRGHALALLAEEAALCAGGCGHPADEAHDPASARTWQVRTTTCQACRVRDAQMESDGADPKKTQRGLLYGVVRTQGVA